MDKHPPYSSKARWPAPLGHLEEFITDSGHDLTIDHSKGERIEDRYAELQREMEKKNKPDEPLR